MKIEISMARRALSGFLPGAAAAGRRKVANNRDISSSFSTRGKIASQTADRRRAAGPCVRNASPGFPRAVTKLSSGGHCEQPIGARAEARPWVVEESRDEVEQLAGLTRPHRPRLLRAGRALRLGRRLRAPRGRERLPEFPRRRPFGGRLSPRGDVDPRAGEGGR